MNRNVIESPFWGKSIASARTNEIISEQEAKFLIEQYLQEFREKNAGMGELISIRGFSEPYRNLCDC